MALSALVVWEVRPSVGSDSSGGGFDPSVTSPGTDYSQQNSAQYSGTDGTAVGTTAFTSASHSFVSADVGNLINIASGSGFTAGFYTIVSVATGTATLDRSPGTGTLAHYAVGGALATLQPLVTTSGYGGNANAINGNTIYIKATGTITITSAIAFQRQGPNPIIGYSTTRADQGRVSITTSTNSISMFQPPNNAYTAFYNLSCSNTAGTPGHCLDSQSNTNFITICDNCVFDGFSQTMVNASDQVTLINCELKNDISTTYSVFVLATLVADGCFFHGNAGPAIYFSTANGGVAVSDSVFYSNKYGIFNNNNGTKGGFYVRNCAFVSNTSDGINAASNSSLGNIVTVNCIFDSNGGYGINCSSTAPATAGSGGRNNAFRNNTSGARNNFPVLPGDINLSAAPFTNPSGGDFTLNSTAGGGAACKAAGYQSTLI